MEHGNIKHHEDYVELAHVPLIMVFPRRRLGLRPREMVGSVDILPTILEAVGISPPAHIQGVSLMPLIAEDAGRKADQAVFGQFFNSFSVRDSRYTYIIKNQCGNIAAWNRGCVSQELYDRSVDPKELKNIAAVFPELVERKHDLLLERFKNDGVTLQDPWISWISREQMKKLLDTGYW